VHAGPEIGVASTKAFTAQLMMLLLLSLHFAEQRDTLSKNKIQAYLEELEVLPEILEEVLLLEPEIFSVARVLEKVSSVLYLGRGLMAPLAYEGALKLKELSYIHAEGYPGGELKHGPIALLDEGSTVVFLAPFDSYFEKTLANIQEVAARDASLIILTDAKGKTYLEHLKAFFIVLPATSFVTAPFVYVLALQLLSYHTAFLRGKDVDQPRNLAKSVTVE
jgi:glucosamine--fructose-6-phosphate aminotransferase (isomerizing)